MESPELNVQLWQIANVVGLLLIIFLIVRLIRRKNNRNVLVLCFMVPLAQSCSLQHKNNDPIPSSVTKSTNDVALGEVVVVGYRAATLSISELQSLGFGDYDGFGFNSGSGGGGGIGSGGGGTGSGGSGGGIPPEQVADENSPPEPTGQIHVMRFNRSNNLTQNIMVEIDKGAITQVKSYYNGLTAGSTYSQYIWTQNSASNGNYTFTFIFHFSYTLFFEGLGEVATGRPVQGVVHFNSNTGDATIAYSFPK